MQRAAARCMRTAWTRPLGVLQLPCMESSALTAPKRHLDYCSPKPSESAGQMHVTQTCLHSTSRAV